MTDERWVERMKIALEQIIEGVEDYDDREPGERFSSEDVARIARRALDRREWERVHE
jgi:hypothetical protein